MKERERGKGQGTSRRRAGCWRQGSVGGYWGGGGVSSSTQKDSGKYNGVEA